MCGFPRPAGTAIGIPTGGPGLLGKLERPSWSPLSLEPTEVKHYARVAPSSVRNEASTAFGSLQRKGLCKAVHEVLGNCIVVGVGIPRPRDFREAAAQLIHKGGCVRPSKAFEVYAGLMRLCLKVDSKRNLPFQPDCKVISQLHITESPQLQQ